MKNFQANLLMVLALALCGLCVWQWYVQTRQRDAIQSLNQLVYQRNAAIQGYTNSLATLNSQIAQMDARMSALKAAAATNEDVIASQSAEITSLRFTGASLTNEIAQYKSAVDTLEAKLKEVYAGVDKQNEAISNLVSQRNDLVQKYNDEVKDRNNVVAKYNELAKQVEKLQSAQKNE
jgi:chromosome segregation ATPase